MRGGRPAPRAGGDVTRTSLFSDELLRQLIAVGNVDVIVGVPTHNNAATIVDVVKTVQAAFVQLFPRERTVLIALDGGSTDGTTERLQSAAGPLGKRQSQIMGGSIRSASVQ
jgi:hypothetical protein